MTQLKQTRLNALHRQINARMVDFGGWDMPVNYGSQIDEHHFVRQSAGMFDVSHMCVVELYGEKTRDFLRYALANNVDKLQVIGKALYSCMLNPQGGVIDDLIVYFFGNHFRLVVNASTAEKDIAWLEHLNATEQWNINIVTRRDLSIIAVQGPDARNLVWQAIPKSQELTETLKPFNAVIVPNLWNNTELMIARTGYTGEDGFEIICVSTEVEALWNTLRDIGVKPCGLGARDTLRLEAGMNLYGQDMDETQSPLNAGLAWTVDLTSKRDFVGKTSLVAQGQTQQFFGLILLDKGGVLRPHQTVHTAHGTGEITSGSFSPTLQCSLAFARLPKEIALEDIVHVEIRDKKLAAKVVRLPFVRHGKAL